MNQSGAHVLGAETTHTALVFLVRPERARVSWYSMSCMYPCNTMHTASTQTISWWILRSVAEAVPPALGPTCSVQAVCEHWCCRCDHQRKETSTQQPGISVCLLRQNSPLSWNLSQCVCGVYLSYMGEVGSKSRVSSISLLV